MLDKIIGKWQVSKDVRGLIENYEFKKDGTVIYQISIAQRQIVKDQFAVKANKLTIGKASKTICAISDTHMLLHVDTAGENFYEVLFKS